MRGGVRAGSADITCARFLWGYDRAGLSILSISQCDYIDTGISTSMGG